MTLTGEIKQQASSYVIGVTLPKSELQPKLDKYWDEVKDILPDSVVKAAQKGGYRTISRNRVVKVSGGKSKFYAPVLIDIVEEYLGTQQRQALTVNAIDIKLEGEMANIASTVFLEPEVTWKKKLGIDEPLVLEHLNDPDNIVELLVEEELKKKQGDSVVLTPLPDNTVVESGHIVVVDGNSAFVKDGGTLEQWAPGCVTNKKWLASESDFKQPEMLTLLLGATKGDVRTADIVLNDKFGDDAGKTVRVTVKIKEILHGNIPKIDDDLAKTNGYDSLEIMRQALTTGIKKKVIERKARAKKMQIISAIVNPDIVNVGPIPIEWMRAKGQELYAEARSYVKTEEELLAAFAGATTGGGIPVDDRNSLIRFLAEKASVDLVQDLVVRSWGKMAGVDGDATLKNLQAYSEQSLAKLMEVAVYK